MGAHLAVRRILRPVDVRLQHDTRRLPKWCSEEEEEEEFEGERKILMMGCDRGVKEEHQLDALQPASFVSNSNISSSSSSSSSRKKVRVCLPKAFAPGRCRPIGAQLRLARRARLAA